MLDDLNLVRWYNFVLLIDNIFNFLEEMVMVFTTLEAVYVGSHNYAHMI